ncbi:hypothetical protein AVEN_209339-1 [Araneus ventricosus]|uniref:Uncharacterized protein n=1 Tax=Araneus ventricosus TaxID=182803 RepID=A0A4Y2CBE0_ARAVE|nr:hypothetical protein AVEN_209339-1 [Araneus ventricosus]
MRKAQHPRNSTLKFSTKRQNLSGKEILSSTLSQYLTGRLKMKDKTGKAFCVMEENTTKYEWTQPSKQSILLYWRLVLKGAKPTNRLRYGETASRVSILLLQLTPTDLFLNKHRKSY